MLRAAVTILAKWVQNFNRCSSFYCHSSVSSNLRITILIRQILTNRLKISQKSFQAIFIPPEFKYAVFLCNGLHVFLVNHSSVNGSLWFFVHPEWRHAIFCTFHTSWLVLCFRSRWVYKETQRHFLQVASLRTSIQAPNHFTWGQRQFWGIQSSAFLDQKHLWYFGIVTTRTELFTNKHWATKSKGRKGGGRDETLSTA